MQHTIITSGILAAALAVGSVATIGSAHAQPANEAKTPLAMSIRQATPASSFHSFDSQMAAPSGQHPLFHIGNLPATVWAPVQSPYDGRNDRNAAANPFWQADDTM
jgi:hypothetical protein